MFRKTLVYAGLATLVSISKAEEHPNVARGVSPFGTFAMGELDSLSPFSGNLLIRIPIRSYSVGGALDYSFSLAYNSNIWDTYVYENVDQWVRKYATRTSNAGIGFFFGISRLVPAGTFGPDDPKRTQIVLADGARSEFYDKLHTSDSEDAGDTPGQRRTFSTVATAHFCA